MLKCTEPKIVFDPYQILPSYGESDIEVIFKSGELLLKIIFDDEETEEERVLTIIFQNPVFYKVESFPGVKGMNVKYESGDTISSLIEFSKSEYRKEWEKHFNDVFQLVHNKVYFLNVNKSVEVISESFRVIQ